MMNWIRVPFEILSLVFLFLQILQTHLKLHKEMHSEMFCAFTSIHDFNNPIVPHDKPRLTVFKEENDNDKDLLFHHLLT